MLCVCTMLLSCPAPVGDPLTGPTYCSPAGSVSVNTMGLGAACGPRLVLQHTKADNTQQHAQSQAGGNDRQTQVLTQHTASRATQQTQTYRATVKVRMLPTAADAGDTLLATATSTAPCTAKHNQPANDTGVREVATRQDHL
jgi:hypothetical protein